MFRYVINQFKDYPDLMIFIRELCKLLTIEQKIQLYEIIYRPTGNVILTKNKTLYFNQDTDQDTDQDTYQDTYQDTDQDTGEEYID